MGYRFQGFFSDGDATVLEAARSRWSFCTAKLIGTPFRGFGLCIPNPESEAESDDEYDRLLELVYGVEDDLPEFSRNFPTSNFVFIDADCFGGTCIYSGFVARAGAVLFRTESVKPGWEPLQHLLDALGVRLESGGRFAPFVRGYWGRV